LNNPLIFVDPTGYSWLSNFGDWLEKIGRAVVTTVVSITVTAVIAAIIVSSCGTAAAAGAVFLRGMAGGFAGGVTGAALNGGDFIDCMGAGMMGMMMSAVTMGVMQGIGGIPLNPLGKQWALNGGIATKADVSVWASNIFGHGTKRSIINGISNGLLASGGSSASAGGIIGAASERGIGAYRRDGDPNIGLDFYYNAVDGMIFNDGTIMSRHDFVISLNSDPTANGRYLGFINGKHHVNFSMYDYEVTKPNIQALMIHEAYGHGVKGYSDDFLTHHRAYFATIDSRYWDSTTWNFKNHNVKKMWGLYFKEGGYQRMPEPYQTMYDKYNKK